ncbi:MAG: ATP-binding cassette domain-containing protein [Gammaproteobacteria bacterium]|nr:ATP-binding cassette domain-containing protein [Gammaproteobacteria bacterium]
MDPIARLTLKQLSTLNLQPVSLSIHHGETISISGPSGAGKSLLLRSICDLIEHQGDVLLNGVSYLKIPAHLWRKYVGMLAAESYWWHERMGDHFNSIDDDQLAELGLSAKLLDQNVTECSTGERQRLALLRLLHNRPQVLLLDEPTSGLDQASAKLVETVIANYVSKEQAAVIWVSHDPQQCQRVAQHRFEIKDGSISEVSR